MITRRTFLQLLGLAPVAAVLPKLPAPAPNVAPEPLIAHTKQVGANWGTSFGDMVTAIHLGPDGSVFVGGNFTNCGGGNSDHITKYMANGAWHNLSDLTDSGRAFVTGPGSLYELSR